MYFPDSRPVLRFSGNLNGHNVKRRRGRFAHAVKYALTFFCVQRPNSPSRNFRCEP